MVNTIKFSQFIEGSLNDASNETVGLGTGVNVRLPKIYRWTTATRPATPFDGLLGYNLDNSAYEYWDEGSSTWVAIASSNILALLASHDPGEGASLVGLEGTGTVQDLANVGFIVKTPNTATPNAFSLSTLSTGILKNTTTTGIPTISSPLSSIDELTIAPNEFLITTGTASYGTLGPLTNGQLLIGSTANPPVPATLTAGMNVTITNSAGGITISASGGGSGTVTSISAGTGLSSTPNPITTTGVIQLTSPVDVTLGGTGITTTTAFAVLCGGTTATGAFQSVSGLGSSGQVLTSNGNAALPTWQNVTGTGTVSSGTVNQVAYYAATGTTVSGLATIANGVLRTNGSGVPSLSTILPTNIQVTDPRIINSIQTSSGATQLSFSPSVTPVNFINIQSTDTGTAPGIEAFGTDTNVSLQLGTKGIGNILLTSGISSTLMARFNAVASAVNFLNFTPATTTNTPSIQASGSDTNVGLNLSTQGAGTLSIYSNNITNLVSQFVPIASSTNYLLFRSATTTNSPSITSNGSDSSVSMNLLTKGNTATNFNFYNDALGAPNLLFQINGTASAVNYWMFGAASTTNSPSIAVAGADTNININIQAKGTGGVAMFNNGFAVLATFNQSGAGTPVNFMRFFATTTGTSPVLMANGTDTNINLDLQSQGTGRAQIKGISTNAGAPTGYVGEYLTASLASGSATSLTSGTAKTITSLALTAGDWDVWGSVVFVPAVTTVMSAAISGINTTTNVFGTAGSDSTPTNNDAGFATNAGIIQQKFTGIGRQLTTGNTIFLVAQATFTISTLTAYGFIAARRRS